MAYYMAPGTIQGRSGLFILKARSRIDARIKLLGVTQGTGISGREADVACTLRIDAKRHPELGADLPALMRCHLENLDMQDQNMGSVARGLKSLREADTHYTLGRDTYFFPYS